jgi:hypothetical protein
MVTGRRWRRAPIVLALQIAGPGEVQEFNLPDDDLARGFGWSEEAGRYVEAVFGRGFGEMAVEASIITGERPIVPLTAAIAYRLRDDKPPLWRELSDCEAFLIASPADAPEDAL